MIRRGREEGFALIFLHYFGGSSRAWSGVIDQLQGEHRCIAPDLRGFGQSDAPAKGYAVSDYADDVAALIHELDLARYALVGHSMGGKVALALAARHPPGLEALVLLAPSPPTPEPIAETERARLIASHGDRAAAEDSARKITALPLSDVTLRMVVEDAVRSSRAAWLAWLECGSQEDISPMMSAVAVPTLVIAGASDPHLAAELLEREVFRPLARAGLITLPDVGHLLPIEAPAAVAQLIREFNSQQTGLQGTPEWNR